MAPKVLKKPCPTRGAQNSGASGAEEFLLSETDFKPLRLTSMLFGVGRTFMLSQTMEKEPRPTRPTKFRT